MMQRLAAVLFASLALGALAADPQEFKLVIENHKFTPDRVEIPAGQKVRFIIENKDATPEEFDSSDLRIEKVIPGKATAPVYVGPLKAGEYKFMGEYHEATARGVVVAK